MIQQETEMDRENRKVRVSVMSDGVVQHGILAMFDSVRNAEQGKAKKRKASKQRDARSNITPIAANSFFFISFHSFTPSQPTNARMPTINLILLMTQLAGKEWEGQANSTFTKSCIPANHNNHTLPPAPIRAHDFDSLLSPPFQFIKRNI